MLRPGATDRRSIAEVEALLDRLATLAESVPDLSACSPDSEIPQSLDALLAETRTVLAEVEPVQQRCAARRSALEAEQASLQHYRSLMERLAPLVECFVELEGVDTVALIIRPSYGFVLDALREELNRATHQQCELVATESLDGTIAALLVFSRRFSAEVHRLLQGEQLTEARLPAEYRGRPFREALAELAERQAAIPWELASFRDELDAALRPRAADLARLRAGLLDRLDELLVVSQGVESDYTFALGGWLPERDLPRLRQVLDRAFGGQVVVQRRALTRADRAQAPVLLENSPVVRPFQVLLRLLAPPRYGTVDPTPFLALFFPLFFGLMLGDIGYGVVLLAAAVWLVRRARGPEWLQQAARVLLASSLVAIACGFAFGELFGDFGSKALGLRPLLVQRTQAIQPLLLFCIALGAAQVGLGLILGVVNGLLEHHRREALAKAGTLLGLVAVFATAAAAAGYLPRGSLTPGVALLVGATALLIYSAGIAGPIEVFGVVGNVLSYTRLVALGLASAVLAEVGNDLAGRTGSLVAGLIVAAMFHALNLALGLFSPSIHSLRLQYVEFFGRFYEGGGRPFAPFRRRGAGAGPLALAGASAAAAETRAV